MKETIIQQLKERVGLSQDQAEQAYAVVEQVLEGNGMSLVEGVTDKLPGGVGDALGGMLGKK